MQKVALKRRIETVNSVKINFLSIILLTLSFFTSIYIFITVKETKYFPIVILPFSFFFSVLLFGKNIELFFKSPVITFLIGGYFIKLVLTPFLFAAGNYITFYSVNISSENMWKAVLLMMLDNLAVFLAINYYGGRFAKGDLKQIKGSSSNSSLLSVIIISLLFLLIFAYLYVPVLKELYIFLPNADFRSLSNIRWENETIVPRGTMQRYIFSLFGFLFPFVRTILPALLIRHIYLKLGISRISIFLSSLCLLIPFILLSSDNIGPFLGAILGGFTMIRLYKRKTYGVLFVLSLLLSIIFITIVSSKIVGIMAWTGDYGVANYSNLVQDYFPGFENVAITLEIQDEHILKTLFFDLYYCIPFKETLFGLQGENLSDLYNGLVGTGGHIVPFVGQVSHYCSFLAPIIIFWFAKKALMTESKSRDTNDFWTYFFNMYLSILIAISLSTYSFSILLRTIVSTILPMWIVIKIGNKRRKLKH